MPSPGDARAYSINTPNIQTGGALLSMTSWGPTWNMEVKPQFGAAGGNILSTCPVGMGAYTVNSTSLAASLVAAAYALIRQVRGNVSFAEMQSLLSVYSDTQLFNNGTAFSPFLAPVVQQGGGLIRVFDAAFATTLIDPPSLSFNDSDAFVSVSKFTISNQNKAQDKVAYNISHVPAVTIYTLGKDSVYPAEFPVETVEAFGALSFSETKVTVQAGQSVTIEVKPMLPRGADARRLPLWSGYVAINGSDGTSLSIPYQGLAGSLKSATVLASNDTWISGSWDRWDVNPVPANTVFEIPKPSTRYAYPTLPDMAFKLALGSPLIRADIVPINVNASANFNMTDVLGVKSMGQMAESPILWL